MPTSTDTTINSVILLKDIISWLIPISLAAFLFWGYQRHHLKVTKSQKDIARLSVLRTLEEDIATIFKNKSAQIRYPDKSDNFEERELRFVLDNVPSWQFIPDDNATPVAGWRPPISLPIEGQRHWLVRNINSGTKQEQYLASQAFQESLLWFRRMERAHRSGVVYTKDLTDLWRFILPYGFSGRLNYFSKYFQGEEEVQSLIYVINETLEGCCVQQWRKPLHYFRQYVSEEDLQILRKGNEKLHREVASHGA